MQQELIKLITKHLKNCEDIDLLDLVLKLLIESGY